ncbi:MAG: alpha/beta hydrolase [Chloroflexi bacterium]|nr:alpha/beta hydrolase [Chloroflexota bacterium]
MPTVRANGIDIHYTVEGAGPPMVMLHGATSSSLEDWSAQRPLFRRAFNLHLVDARGHAGTRWDARQGLDKDLLVDDLLAFADAVGLSTFHVVGFSLGAMTALTFATRFPERLRTALIAGIDVKREPRTRVARRLMDPERIEREEPAWARQLERRHGPVQGEGAWKDLLRAIAGDVGIQPLLTPVELRRARVPTLLVYGDRDPFVPVDHAVTIYRQLPDARLFVAPGSGHQVMAQRPGIFNEAAATFYRATESLARERARARGRAVPLPAGRTGVGDGNMGARDAPDLSPTPRAGGPLDTDVDVDGFQNW